MTEPTETSPLLTPEAEGSDEATTHETIDDSDPPASVPATEYFKRPIKYLTTVILVASIVELVLIIGTDIVAHWGPFTSTGGATTPGLEYLGFLIILTLVVSIANTYYLIYILLNIAFDIILAIAVISTAASLVNEDRWPEYGWCGKGGYVQPGTPPVSPHCGAWKLALQILIGFSAGFGEIVGIGHLVLFVLRVIAGFRAQFWRRPFRS